MARARAQRTGDGWFVSPAIIARADSPIAECLKRMVADDVGSTLVLADDGSDRLEGIFTERDLLRNVELLRDGKFWDKPVRTVMSHPVRTVELSELARAGEIMLTYGFRHLPVVRSEAKHHDLVGVVSMRDLYRAEWERGKGKQPPALAAILTEGGASGRIGVLETGFKLRQILERAFEGSDEVKWESHTPAAALDNKVWKASLPKLSAVAADLDGVEEKVWGRLLKEVHDAGERPPIFVVYDPLKQAASARAILEKLAASPRFFVFQRPLNVSQMMLRLAPHLLSKPDKPIR